MRQPKPWGAVSHFSGAQHLLCNLDLNFETNSSVGLTAIKRIVGEGIRLVNLDSGLRW